MFRVTVDSPKSLYNLVQKFQQPFNLWFMTTFQALCNWSVFRAILSISQLHVCNYNIFAKSWHLLPAFNKNTLYQTMVSLNNCGIHFTTTTKNVINLGWSHHFYYYYSITITQKGLPFLLHWRLLCFFVLFWGFFHCALLRILVNSAIYKIYKNKLLFLDSIICSPEVHPDFSLSMMINFWLLTSLIRCGGTSVYAQLCGSTKMPLAYLEKLNSVRPN